MKRPLLSLLPVPNDTMFRYGNLVSTLGALQALYVVSQVKLPILSFLVTRVLSKPLEIRESLPEKARKAELLGLDCPQADKIRKLALALESGRFVF